MKSHPPTTPFDTCLQEMFRLHRFGIKLGLDVITGMLACLGNPHRKFHAIHIAGTNGKGSVAAGFASILQTSGYRVGLYTSPHLVKFNERIRVDGAPVSDEAVVDAYRAVRKSHRAGREPTFFEFATAMAFFLFQRQGIEWAVVETGMGGRLDATNVVAPALTLITNISLEHRAYLGNTIARIAAEKGGIIKPGVPVVTGIHQPSALAVVRRIAARHGAPLFCRGEHFGTRREPRGGFAYRGMHLRWKHLRTGLMGVHQVGNASLVLAGCEVLQQAGSLRVTREQVATGLEHTRWPGRLEAVRQDPLVILDGAHNLDAVRKLAAFAATGLAGRSIILVAGILDDKPYRLMLRVLLPLCRRAIFTAPRIARALPAEKLAEFAAGQVAEIRVADSVAHGLRMALESAGRDEVILVAGSLYVVGEAKEALDFYPELLASPPSSPIGA